MKIAQKETCKKFKVTSEGGTVLDGVVLSYTERDGADDLGMSGRVFNNEGSSSSVYPGTNVLWQAVILTPQSATKIALVVASTGK